MTQKTCAFHKSLVIRWSEKSWRFALWRLLQRQIAGNGLWTAPRISTALFVNDANTL